MCFFCGWLFFTEYNNSFVVVHVVACVSNSFLFIDKWYSTVYHILFIHLPGDRHFGCFHILAIVKNATMIICVQVFVWSYVFMFTDDLREIGFRHLEEGEEYPVLEKLGSGILFQLNWGEEVSPVPNVSLSGNQRALQDHHQSM